MKIFLPLCFAAAIGLQGCVSTLPVRLNTDTAAVQTNRDFSKLSGQVTQAMAQHKLPGLSIAVFDNYKIVHTQQWGVKSSLSDDTLGPRTAFSTASISKPVTALLCIMLEERGLLDLDEPIERSLRSWSIPESEFTKDRPITWRDLLGHRAGTSQHGFADFYEGDKLPNLVDSLQGKIPRYDGEIEIRSRPGTKWQYSGGGYVIVQLALEDRFGIPLHKLVQEHIFRPLEMHDTTMVQPGSPGFPENVALVHNEEARVIRTGLPITPQVSASGMWSTPQDLAKFAIAIQTALKGTGDSAVSTHAAHELTQVISLKDVGGMGLSVFRGFGFGGIEWFEHDGSNTGVGSDLLASMEGGRGIIMMANGDKPNRHPLFALLRREVIATMDWRDSKNAEISVAIPDQLTEAILGRYTGLLYDLGLPYEIVREGDGLAVVSPFFEQFLGVDRSPMHYIGNNRFIVEDYPNILTFEQDSSGALKRIITNREGSDALPFARDTLDVVAKSETE